MSISDDATLVRVAPGWRPPPRPQALACALAAHAAHVRARLRTTRHCGTEALSEHCVAPPI